MTQIEYGTLRFNGSAMPLNLQAPQPNGPLQLYIDSLAGGLRPNLSPVNFSVGQSPRRSDGSLEPLIYFSEGAYGLHLGKCCLPYVNTTQTALISVDHSGFRAANLRVHSMNSDLGALGTRWYAGIGKRLVRDTSLTDPALVVADTLTDNITCISHITMASTRYLTVGTDGTTDDIKGTTDPTASPPTWATLIPLTSGDYVSGMHSIATLAGGINLFLGKFNGVKMLGFNRFSDALLTLPSPVNISTGAADPTVVTDASYANCGTAADDATIGTVSWTNPSNATALDATYATIILNANTSHYLKCTNYGFAVPTTAIIVGVEIMVVLSSNDAVSPDPLWTNIRLVNDSGSFVGKNQAASEPGLTQSTADTSYFFGGSGDNWGVVLTPTVVNDADFGVGIALRNPDANNETLSVDVVAMTVYYKTGTDFVSVTKSPTKALQVLGAESTVKVPWNVPSNILTSNNTDARATWSLDADQNTNLLYAYSFGMGIPETATIIGIVAQVERAESNAAANGTDETIQLLKAFTAVGSNKAVTSQEWETTDTIAVYGEPDDLWGTTWTPAEVNAPGFGLLIAVELDANAVDVDHVQLTVYYQLPPTAISFSVGGMMIGDPFAAEKLYIIAPESDQAALITIPRHLYILTVSWDETDNVPVGTLSKPYTGLPYVAGLCPFQGGVALFGGSSSILFNRVNFLTSGGEVRELNFPVTHGTNALTITALFAQGEFLIADTAYSDGTEAQRFLYYDGEWFPEWVQQDKASAISTEPLLWGRSELNLQQNYAYRFYPVSTTALATAREFVPPSLYADPLLANTSIVKQDGPLYTQLSELFPIQPENDYALMLLQAQSRFIDNNTSYGSLRVLVDTGGDRTITSAEVDITFDAAGETFVDSNIAASENPGAAYKSLIIRLILNHETATAETPDVLPVGFFSVAQGKYLEQFQVVLAKEQSEDIVTFIARLRTLKATKTVQRFKGGGYNVPAVIDSFDIEYEPTLGVSLPSWETTRRAAITFSRVPGATS